MKQPQIEIPPKTKGRGGAREGAGRKPKALRYAADVAKAEEKILLAMPEIIDSLILCAKRGDSAAGRYLMDRIFGRPKEATAAPPAEDTKEPFNEEDFERNQRHNQAMNELMDLAY